MSAEGDGVDWDDAYANAAHIPRAETYPPRWAAAAAAFRAKAGGQIDVPYGPHPRQRLDLFQPQGLARGVVMFVHGGYWMRFDKSVWSHLAAGPLAHGWAVAMPSYRLVPEVAIADITRDITAALQHIAQMHPDGPIHLTGHSAGGHLAARMLCDDVPLSPEVASRIARVVPISPVSDLRPLRKTQMNERFRLDEAAARAESPALRTPRPGVPVTVWVGGAERPVFLDQARWLAAAWPGAALKIEEGSHHFDVIAGLEQPDSALTGTVAGA
ncbi:putative esterase [Rhodovulum sp. P5]|uniref:alpha/beta hydrolase n=1 Tax=Rhodovulum sp. P5 TaxID=1564506 RepID=UPI0009C2C110|nr:alpha/beta hydrolase [Rhodovulum sp. P5]ARE38643.1 putative esterase [Rhodovulum sp. P5]